MYEYFFNTINLSTIKDLSAVISLNTFRLKVKPLWPINIFQFWNAPMESRLGSHTSWHNKVQSRKGKDIATDYIKIEFLMYLKK